MLTAHAGDTAVAASVYISAVKLDQVSPQMNISDITYPQIQLFILPR